MGTYNLLNTFHNFPRHWRKHDEYLGVSSIKEEDNQYKMEAKVPGVHKNQLNIEYTNNVLSVYTNDRKDSERKDPSSYSYNYNFYIPDHIEVSGIKAELTQGILTLTLPKTEKSLSKKIEISEVV